MPTIYSASSTQWPLLQSKSEQKFKSGLFNVSAEFIRPVGNTALPTQIETSIGPVEVWPEPTVSSGTDGFERINATGYGVWDLNAEEVVFGYEVADIQGVATQKIICNTPDYWELTTLENGNLDYVLRKGCGDTACGQFFKETILQRSRTKQIILGTVSIKKIGSELPENPGLKFYDTNFNELTSLTSDFFIFGAEFKNGNYSGNFSVNPIVNRVALFRQNNFGGIIESEVVFALSCPQEVDFGYWTPPQPQNCDPGPKPEITQ